MVIKGINIKLNSNRKLWCIILGAITIAVILIVITVISLSKTTNTSKLDQEDIFKLDKYIAEYQVNIKSNKNSNTYLMKEYYIKKDSEESFRFETMNEDSSNMTYIISNNKLHIKADEQISEYTLSSYIVSKKNILSISTFIDIYNKVKDNNSKLYRVETQEYEDKLCYRIVFDLELIKEDNKTNEILSEYNSILRDGVTISKLELIVNRNSYIPIEYFVYDKDGNAYIDILYNNFTINGYFDQKLFAF